MSCPVRSSLSDGQCIFRSASRREAGHGPVKGRCAYAEVPDSFGGQFYATSDGLVRCVRLEGLDEGDEGSGRAGEGAPGRGFGIAYGDSGTQVCYLYAVVALPAAGEGRLPPLSGGGHGWVLTVPWPTR